MASPAEFKVVCSALCCNESSADVCLDWALWWASAGFVLLSAAKCLRMSFLQICLMELDPEYVCQIFLKGGSCWLSVWTELFPVSVLNFSRRAALSAAKYLLMSVFKSVSRSYFWCLPGSPTIFLPICLSLFSVSDEVGVHSPSVSVRCQLGVFSVSPNVLCQNLSDLLLIFLHTKFISRLYKCRHLQV